MIPDIDYGGIEDYDAQVSTSAENPDPRFLPGRDHSKNVDGAGFPIGASGTAASVILRELCSSGNTLVRKEYFGGEWRLCLIDGLTPGARPWVVLRSDWEGWGDALWLAIGNAEERRLDDREAWGFRAVPEALDRAREAFASIASDTERSRWMHLVDGLESLYDNMRSPDTCPTDWTWDQWSDEFWELQDLESNSMEVDPDSDATEGDAVDLTQVLYELEGASGEAQLVETDVHSVLVAPWDDDMTWGALSASQQMTIAMTVIEEDLQPTSRLACLLMHRHPETDPGVRALIGLSHVNQPH